MLRFDVIIAGELNLDLILYGPPDELPPERELITDRVRLTLGSSSAIVAHNLAALGRWVGFQSRIGDDSPGQIALERLSESLVDVSRVLKASGPIKTALSVILQRKDWRNILTYAGTIFDLPLDHLDFEFPFVEC
jgi:sugar/nucleoside kinase (ribokinase family)